MSSNCVSSCLLLLLVLLSSSCKFGIVRGQSSNFRVTDFGAIADGKTDNSKAFVDAWKKACETVGGMVTVPHGTYFVREAGFNGPCNGNTEFQLDGTLIASSDPMLGDRDHWIMFYKVDGLRINGKGTFDGNGANSWRKCEGIKRCKLRPTTLKINYATNAEIRGIKLVNSKMFQLHIHESQRVIVSNVDIQAPDDSPNTDGIHIGDSSDIDIIDSLIATGDDCISMGEGTSNIYISGISCGPGHGISIGSLGKYKAENAVSGITVTGCTFNRTSNGLRIKTWAPSSANTVTNVTFSDIIVSEVKNPILIDQFYCPDSSCSREGESSVQIKGVKFIDVRGTSASPTSVNIQCSRSQPCQDIEFAGLHLTFRGQPTNASCSNVDDRFRGSDQVPSGCP